MWKGWFNISSSKGSLDLKKYIDKCSICKREYYKQNFVKCDHCGKFICLKCTLFAGKYGKYCKNCFKGLPHDKKSQISKAVKKVKFWANNGYILFIILLGCTIFSFSLYFLNYIFFIIGLILGISTAIYGYFLLRFLSQS